jgi:hypothetical protein
MVPTKRIKLIAVRIAAEVRRGHTKSNEGALADTQQRGEHRFGDSGAHHIDAVECRFGANFAASG